MVHRPLLPLLIGLSLLGLPVRGGRSAISRVQGAASPAGAWTNPINLSHSGSASNPQLIIDSSGRFHGIWLDAFDGYMDSESLDGQSWSRAVPENFPFGVKDSTPMFVADTQGVIHAFWRDSTNALLYSRVTSYNFRSAAQWLAPINVADAVAAFDAVADQAGVVHLAYVVTVPAPGIAATLPAGFYYRDTSAAGSKWSSTRDLFLSPYLRSTASDQTHVKIAMSDNGGNVYVVWDYRPLKRIVLSRSSDGGKSWIDPVTIQQPDASLGAAAPYNGNLIVAGSDLLFIWQAATAGGTCALKSQLSHDMGATWSPSVPIYQNLAVCPQDSRLALTADKAVIITSYFANQVALAAWNGSEWSNPQPVLSGFTDPVTLDPVVLSCQTVVVGGAQLFTIGCVQGSGDIWLSSQPNPSMADWFPPASKWTAPRLLATSQTEFSSVTLVPAGQNHLRTLWVQNFYANNTITSTISTAIWDGQQWGQPVPVIGRQDEISHLKTATDGQRLWAVWSEAASGQIYFSFASVSRIEIPAEWSKPTPLVPNASAVTSPDLMVDTSGAISVVYAQAVNENRGIYLIKSQDRGATWSTAVKVFDAAAAGWGMVGAPQLEDSGGAWNAIWTRYPLPGSHATLGLFAAQSRDGGQTWSAPPPELLDGRLNWSGLLGSPNQATHRLWQMSDGSDRIIWHQVSNDLGDTWSPAASISGLAAYAGLPAAALDAAGQLHLFQTKRNVGHSPEVDYWLWSAGAWTSQDSLSLDDTSGPADYLAAAITGSGQLVLIYPGTAKDASSGSALTALYYSSRTVDLPAGTITATSQAAATPGATTIVQSTPLVTVPATTVTPISNPKNEAAPSPAAASNPWLGVILAGGLVGILVGGVFAYRLIGYRQR